MLHDEVGGGMSVQSHSAEPNLGACPENHTNVSLQRFSLKTYEVLAEDIAGAVNIIVYLYRIYP